MSLFRWFGIGCLAFFAGGLRAQESFPATLRVTVEPAATIAINHEVVTRADVCVKTFPSGGNVLIKVSEPGYKTVYRTVQLHAGDRRHESVELKPEPIPVLFRASEPATVLCNGSELGVTPFYTFFDEARAYRIVFRADGCQEVVSNLDLSNGRPRVVDQTLVSDSGTLQIATRPVGARVFVNGVARGTAPCTLARVREGEHTLSIRAEGYKPLEHTLRVAAGETVPVTLELERLPAGLTVSTIPSGARVYVDDVYRGESDLTIPNLPDGTHRVKVTAPGYATAIRQVQMKAGATHVEEFELVVIRGAVAVKTSPAAVRIFDGNKPIGETAPGKTYAAVSEVLRLSLVPGEHLLRFEADGYKSVTRKVTISANQTATLNVKLAFHPNCVVVTRAGTYRGVLVRKNEKGELTIETKPGSYRTFLPNELVSWKLLKE